MPRVLVYKFPFFLKFALAWIWIGSYFIRERTARLSRGIMIYVCPLLAFYIASILLYLLNGYGDISVVLLVSRGTSLAFQKITAVLFAYCSIRLFKKRFLTNTLLGFVTNNIMGIIYALINVYYSVNSKSL